MEAVTAYLGLGTNLGDRLKNLERAARLLFPSPEGRCPETSAEPGVSMSLKGGGYLQPLRSSSIYETAPWGYTNQPDFLNCVLEVETGLPLDQLLDITQAVEREMGREWSRQYGPRVIDVDILFYGSQAIDQTDLQIPHPRLHQRAFVLVPLAELVPELTHPVFGLTMLEMKAKVDGKSGVKLWGPPLNVSGPDRPAPQA